jgi:hypothetical protein
MEKGLQHEVRGILCASGMQQQHAHTITRSTGRKAAGEIIYHCMLHQSQMWRAAEDAIST